MNTENDQSKNTISKTTKIESKDNVNDATVQIPGIFELTGKSSIPPSLFLLAGLAGTGKTMYCRQFFIDGIHHTDYCIYISPSLNEKKFRSLFPMLDVAALEKNSKFINPYMQMTSNNSNKNNNSDRDELDKLNLTLSEIREILVRQKMEPDQNSYHDNQQSLENDDDEEEEENKNNSSTFSNLSSQSSTSSSSYTTTATSSRSKSIRIVVDSLTQLFVLFGEGAVLKFVGELSLLLKEFEAAGIFTLTTSLASPSSLTNAVSSMLDGILEMKVEEGKDESLSRSIRIISINGIHHKPAWIQFNIKDDGSIVFGDQSAISLSCTMCGKPILGTPILDSEFAFDSMLCLETYRKLAVLYGSSISDTGLPSQVVNVNFFFIDIVGLSNPSLSVKKQIDKIEILNKLIGSCDAFAKAKEKKIVLPTGDGMAIGFFMHPDSPLHLAVQLHSKLRTYNRGKNNNEDKLGVRIGLSSGPIFIVNDMNGNQNVWGPGIILARRVMDIGDDMHILLSGGMAESLIALKDEYRMMIKPLGKYSIKHGQTIPLYSAFSQEFGNSEPPAKMLSQH
jgi:KaiC/GvpD/RAD55 family RecA-like ATPase/class 3 adenylate cyclase